MRKNYFEGWYFKQQNTKESIAFIPSIHVDKSGKQSGALQVITKDKSYYFDQLDCVYEVNRRCFLVKIGESQFSRSGCRLAIQNKEVNIQGQLSFDTFKPLKYHIMGPFVAMPKMQCRHHIFSTCHEVSGIIKVNEQVYLFSNDLGYLEGDQGFSFPKKYVWTHCNFDKNTGVMLSIADVPLWKTGRSIEGCIGIVVIGEQTYRFATYLGVRLIFVSDGHILIRQRDLELEIWKEKEEHGQILSAPVNGNMRRYVKESLVSSVRYVLRNKGNVILNRISELASFEGEWSQLG